MLGSSKPWRRQTYKPKQVQKVQWHSFHLLKDVSIYKYGCAKPLGILRWNSGTLLVHLDWCVFCGTFLLHSAFCIQVGQRAVHLHLYYLKFKMYACKFALHQIWIYDHLRFPKLLLVLNRDPLQSLQCQRSLRLFRPSSPSPRAWHCVNVLFETCLQWLENLHLPGDQLPWRSRDRNSLLTSCRQMQLGWTMFLRTSFKMLNAGIFVDII